MGYYFQYSFDTPTEDVRHLDMAVDNLKNFEIGGSGHIFTGNKSKNGTNSDTFTGVEGDGGTN